jgi:hypothetical protein
MAKKTTQTAATQSKSAKTSKTTPAKTPTKKAPAAKKVAKKKATTKSSTATTIAIRALIDVGFGNHLHIRGEGAGLSWDAGQPMACLGCSEWQWTSNDAIRPIPFKVLINDHIWSVGNDYIAVPGEITVIEPAF